MAAMTEPHHPELSGLRWHATLWYLTWRRMFLAVRLNRALLALGRETEKQVRKQRLEESTLGSPLSRVRELRGELDTATARARAVILGPARPE